MLVKRTVVMREKEPKLWSQEPHKQDLETISVINTDSTFTQTQ